VLQSNNERFKVGELVRGLPGWQQYEVTNGESLIVLPSLPLDPTVWLGPLGLTGLTAYFGLLVYQLISSVSLMDGGTSSRH
jgi:NADPH-dependent curcumin reductase CurA